jgi:lipopolysaccharide export system protein LptA
MQFKISSANTSMRSIAKLSTTFAATLLLASATITSAHAEKADSQKRTLIDAEHTVFDGKTGTKTLTGSVQLTRGTLLIKAENAVETETADGGGSVVLSGHAGSKVFFRQKRDGGTDLWIEGSADRVEYDKKTEIVRFISKANVRYLSQQKVTQEQNGEFLSYDSINDIATATNSTSGKRVPGAGHVTFTSEPKQAKPEAKQEK